jgi:hypothetical protein
MQRNRPEKASRREWVNLVLHECGVRSTHFLINPCGCRQVTDFTGTTMQLYLRAGPGGAEYNAGLDFSAERLSGRRALD